MVYDTQNVKELHLVGIIVWSISRDHSRAQNRPTKKMMRMRRCNDSQLFDVSCESDNSTLWMMMLHSYEETLSISSD